MRIRHIFAIVAVLAAPASAQKSSLEHEGGARTYHLVVPPNLGAGAKVPLVIVLHGAGGNGRHALATYRWGERAPADGFIAVAPDALPPKRDAPPRFADNPPYWNDLSGRGNLAHQQIDDVGFISALLDQLLAAYPIDADRVFVTGFSSGASMAHLLGMKLSPRLAAIAPVAGRAWADVAPVAPLPVLMIFGEQDPLQPFAGGHGKTPWGDGPLMPPVVEIGAKWARLMGCATTSVTDRLAPLVARETWRGCRGRGEVTFLAIAEQGHHWSQGHEDRLPSPIAGPATAALNTTQVIWEFFLAHPRVLR